MLRRILLRSSSQRFCAQIQRTVTASSLVTTTTDVLLRQRRPALPIVVRSFAKKGKKKKQAKVIAEVEDDESDDDDVEEEQQTEDVFGATYEADLKSKMQGTWERLEQQFARMRGSAPTPELFESARVDAYGSMQPLSAVGQVSIVSATLVEVHCFDPDLSNAVADSLRLLEMNPQIIEGKLTIPFPRPSQEARDLVAKTAAKAAEKAKIRVRHLRQKAKDQVKKVAKQHSEDDVHRRNVWIDSLTDETNKKITNLLEKKKAQIKGE